MIELELNTVPRLGMEAMRPDTYRGVTVESSLGQD